MVSLWIRRRRAAAALWAEGDAILAEVESQLLRLSAVIDGNGGKPVDTDEKGGMMFSRAIGSRLRALGWDGEPSAVVLASLLIRAKRVGIEESAEDAKRPTRSHAQRIATLLDLAEGFGHLPALARIRGACPAVAERETVPAVRHDPVRELLDRR